MVILIEFWTKWVLMRKKLDLINIIIIWILDIINLIIKSFINKSIFNLIFLNIKKFLNLKSLFIINYFTFHYQENMWDPQEVAMPLLQPNYYFAISNS